MSDLCHVLRLGKTEYAQAWQLQERLASEIAAGQRPPTLLLLQHPHTFTFGRRGQIENLLWDKAELARRGVSVHWVDRGGDVTYHGPGQLVGYPLLPLGALQMTPLDGLRLPRADYVGYIRKLEQTLIQALAQFGVNAQRVKGKTGVWVNGFQVAGSRLQVDPFGNRDGEDQGNPADESRITNLKSRLLKIASIGVKVDARGVTRHGFALNVDPDMSYWQGIIACGLADDAMTSLGNWLSPVPAMEAVTEAVVAEFGKIFSYEMHGNTEGL